MTPASPSRIILDGAVLSEESEPPDLVGRLSELRLVQSCLEPAQDGRKPTHVWLYGSPGAGKTAVARAALAKLYQEAGIPSVTVNCWERNSLYEILDHMIGEMKIFRAEEHRTSVKLEKLKRHLNGRCLIILLDEVDKVPPAERAAVLYSLDAIGNTGLICISATLGSFLDVEERVRSRINPRVVSFDQYSDQEIANILTARAQKALIPDTCPDSLVKRIAAFCNGDARIAIQTLRNAAEEAQRVGHEALALSDVAAAWNDSQRLKASQKLANLTEDHRMLCGLVEERKEVLSTRLWDAYLQWCSQVDRRPIASRTFSEYLNQLARLDLLTCERARVKGNVRLLKAQTDNRVGERSLSVPARRPLGQVRAAGWPVGGATHSPLHGLHLQSDLLDASALEVSGTSLPAATTVRRSSLAGTPPTPVSALPSSPERSPVHLATSPAHGRKQRRRQSGRMSAAEPTSPARRPSPAEPGRGKPSPRIS